MESYRERHANDTQTGGVKLVWYLSTYRHFVHNKNAYLNKEIGVFTLFVGEFFGGLLNN